jgi:hypothetical protein
MTRIIITHTCDDTTTTIEDEYLGTIEGLAARLAAIRSAVAGGGWRVAGKDNLDSPTTRHAPPVTLNNGATVTTTPRPLKDEPWTGTRLFAWAQTRTGALEFVQSYGAAHGYPARILHFSPVMCAEAYRAWLAERSDVA